MTAMRTAAMSVLAARHLARPDARSMALIGLGAQSEFQAVAFHALLGIEELVVYDVDPAATDTFRRNLDARDIRVRVAASAPEATEGADIITTATADKRHARSEEHTSELQSLMRISHAVFRLKKKK